MELVYPLGDTLILDKGRRGRVSGEVYHRTVHGQKAVVPETLWVIPTFVIEAVKDGAEHGRRQLGAPLADCGGGDRNACGVENLI